MTAVASQAQDTQQAAEHVRTVLDGVYTEAQAERGHVAYEDYCSGRCHGSDLNGGNPPPLHTAMFLDVWREDYLATLFDFISTRMPKGDRFEESWLREQDYIDILAYILTFNKFPPGAHELTRADMDNTLLVGLNGPEPLPPSAMVRVVGCFSGSRDEWRLSRSSLPARVRVIDETDAIELEKSANSALGELGFQLNNLDQDHEDEELMERLSQKVQVKGVMNGAGDTARIYVLSFETVGESCG
jgi:mono/diheme cytochrome c family protein